MKESILVVPFFNGFRVKVLRFYKEVKYFKYAKKEYLESLAKKLGS